MRVFPRVVQEWRDTRMSYWFKGMKITRKRPNKGLGSYNAEDKLITLIVVPGEFSSVKIVSLFHEFLHHWIHSLKIPKLGVLLDTKTCYLLFGQFYRIMDFFEYHLIDWPAWKLRRKADRIRYEWTGGER